MKLVLFISYYFSKKLTCVSHCHKDLKKYFLMKVNMKFPVHPQTTKISSTQAKKNYLNVFKCLIVSLVPLKFLLWQQHHFCLFLLALSVNLPLCQVCTFYCPLTKKRFNILPKGTGVDMHQHIHQKDFILCLHHVTMPMLFLNCKKHKQEIQLCYGAYNETKKHFEIPICFWFQ